MANNRFSGFARAGLRGAAIAVGLALLHSVPVFAADLLTWAPPAVTHPVTVKFTNGKGYYGPFSDQQDVILQMPKTPVTNKVKVVGGHNLRLIGGAIKPE